MRQNRTLAEWLDYLATIHVTAIDLGLDRILPMAEKLRVTRFDCPVITVAGTNGKGSTMRTMEAILAQSGYRVGCYTSPHLLRFNERLRLNAKVIDDESLVAAFAEVEALRGDISLSFFEFTTLAILRICQQAQLDMLLLEVGLGGRLDAVNVVESDVAVITHLALDHQAWLGNDLEAIGREKAGIMRPNNPVVCADSQLPGSVLSHARHLHAKLYQLGQQFDYTLFENTWQWAGFGQRYSLPLPNLLPVNVATALAALHCLPSIRLIEDDIAKALSGLRLFGRQCVLEDGDNTLIFDVAHNVDAMINLTKLLSKISVTKRIVTIFGMLSDKAHQAAINELTPWVSEWHLVDLAGPRACRAVDLARLLPDTAKVICYPNVAAAWQHVKTSLTKEDCVLVTGSFHTVSGVLEQCENLNIDY